MAAYRPYSGSPDFTASDADRFWKKVNVAAGCWLWIASTDDKGYGMFKLDGRMWKAQRVSWLIHHSDPGPLFVCHACDVPLCVNPRHLFLGTHMDNVNDCLTKGRMMSGGNWRGNQRSRAVATDLR